MLFYGSFHDLNAQEQYKKFLPVGVTERGEEEGKVPYMNYTISCIKTNILLRSMNRKDSTFKVSA